MSDLLDTIPEFNQEPPALATTAEDAPADVNTPTTKAQFGIEDVPVTFDSADALQRFVDRLVFFNQSLQIIQTAWDAVNPATTPPLVFLQQQQEFWVVQRLLTIHRWQQMPEEKRAGFKRLITKPSPSYPTQVDAVMKLTKAGSHMTPAEWDHYETVFTNLYKQYENARDV